MEETEICKICNISPFKYCCPRCNILYCSLVCYKAESHTQCSESFYRENVIQEMALTRGDHQAEQSTRQMVDILKRLDQTEREHEASGESPVDDNDDDEIDSDDGEVEPELIDRMEGVNLNDADAIWNRLTEEERNEFRSMLESGDVSQIMPMLEPWWLVDYKVELVQSISTHTLSKGEQELIQRCPPIKKGIKRFSTISSKTPSPSTKCNMVNVLGAYVFTFRYFNGDFEGSFQEAANCLISICGYLKQSTVYDSELVAIESVCQECLLEKLPAGKESNFLVRHDVTRLQNGPADCGVKYRKYFLQAALSDSHRLINGARDECTQSPSTKPTKGTFSSKYRDEYNGELKYLDPTKLRIYLKKIEFMLSFVRDKL
ncbi:zinc finger HIT domain-containing protein 2 [Toxorhynchites rutilus septentrionalis]|uniref:zinc finger HIT domain-containing protein 2 n=1 Tax=Toxorhynchites rutilus septentrionalis TaxID=329112 RepID=UPI00247AE8E9|nr:zinc finger HIT domain-containing protein 2 [Toxorhynchites rutilus septentrionalis]